MQIAACPHCKKDIEVITATDLQDEFDISPNALQHAREKEEFPSPWLEYPNRNIWLRESITSYASERAQTRVAKRVEELSKLLDTLALI